NAATPGDQIEISGGIYPEAVQVSKPGLKLFGTPGSQVVITNPGGAANGITVSRAEGGTLAGFSLSNVSVTGVAQDGVFLNRVTGFSLTGVTAQGDAEYGLFPVLSSNGEITGCTASGSNDTGIYVGESRNVTVRHSVAFDNVNGIEIENCTACR